MKQRPTNESYDILENTKPEQMEGYLKDNRKYLAGDEKAFYYFMKDTVEAKRIRLKEVYLGAGVSESFGGQIVRMEKHTADRDLIIRLCLAGRFNWEETNRALKLYGMSELYAKNPRDACVMVAINHRMFDIYQVDELLRRNGLERLMNQ